MRKIVSEIMLVIILANILTLISNSIQVKAVETPSSEPAIEIVDFKNGTREMITDFRNGTRNCLVETFVKKTAELLAVPDETNQSVTMTLTDAPIVNTNKAKQLSLNTDEEPLKYVSTTQTVLTRQTMMMGFTYTVAYWQEQWSVGGGWWIFTWYLAVGIDVDIQFGLRLPVNVTLEYPENMLIGNNYTIHATLNPIDKPNFDELLLTFKANVWAEANVAGINIPRTRLIGPNIDESRSFVTPLGSNSAPLPPELEFNILDLILKLNPPPQLLLALNLISYVVVPYLILHPTFGSNNITAKTSASGDAHVIQGADLEWKYPNHTLNFSIHTDEYDPTTNYAKVVLSDFRYYFTKFGVDFELKFDLNNILNEWPLYLPDPVISIATLDLSWLLNYIGKLYLTSHGGYPGSIYVTVYVERVVGPPEKPPLEDVAIAYAYVFPSQVYVGHLVNITVAVKNLGNVTENFNVTIFADNISIKKHPFTGLAAGTEVEFVFEWNTSGSIPWHTYNITAEANVVPNEIDIDNNLLFAGTVTTVLQNPQASFTYSPLLPIENQTVTFDANNSTAFDRKIMHYTWDFGDNSSVTTINPIATHIYASHGNQKAILTIEDSAGLNNSDWQVVRVMSPVNHDVSILNVTVSKSSVYVGRIANITVLVKNKGEVSETFNVTAYRDGIPIGIKLVTDLGIGDNTTLTFSWSTSGLTPCHTWRISANATLDGDTNPADNLFVGGTVKIAILGDVNGDGVIDILDLVTAANAFGATPGSWAWNPQADIYPDGYIDIFDLVAIALRFGQRC